MIRTEREGPVQTIVLDRVARRNALSEAMIVALGEAVHTVGEDATCRCLVFKGAGETFCTGRDLGDGVPARDLASVLARDQVWTDIFHRLHRFPIPTVAVVRGHAVAGGFTLAMGCDFLLAERGAKFGATEMRNAFPAAVNAPVLSRLVGPRLALEMLTFGDLVTAERLYEMGLVNRLAGDAAELARMEADFTDRLAALDPDAVRLTKELNRAALTMGHDDALQMGNNVNSLIAASGRFDEAVAAFAARKKS
ncbi:MAG: enoyl-CoA hydratase/isomerase family protein [Alphaproteobacteria bacterium]|jgi:enoyl-CoA hydratase/carnithine racemase|nr:enoyl-CoA hydratase/isomerase family protein [Alphaproteobacteria bacterium]